MFAAAATPRQRVEWLLLLNWLRLVNVEDASMSWLAYFALDLRVALPPCKP
jgi:hypothetical protein